MSGDAQVFLEIRNNKPNPYQIVNPKLENNKHDLRSNLKTFRIEKSSVLSQAKAFLPLMATANKKLNAQISKIEDPSILDIENIDDYNGDNVIEFNLAVVENDKLDDDDVDNSLFFHAFKDAQPMTDDGMLIAKNMTTNNKQAGIEIIYEKNVVEEDNITSAISHLEEEISDSDSDSSQENTIIFDV